MLVSAFDDGDAPETPNAHNGAHFRPLEAEGRMPGWIAPAAGVALVAGVAAAVLLLTGPGGSERNTIAATPTVAPALDRSAAVEANSIMSGPTMSVSTDGTELAEAPPRAGPARRTAPPREAARPAETANTAAGATAETVTSAPPEAAPARPAAPTPDPAPGPEPTAPEVAPEAATPPVAASDASSGLDPAL